MSAGGEAAPAIGITAVGVHIPRYRLSAKTLAQVWGGEGQGERAIANHDEDSLTMAVEEYLARRWSACALHVNG